MGSRFVACAQTDGRTDGEGKDRQRNMTKCMGSLTFFDSYINANDLYHTVLNVVAI